jgi:hypothetical protein
MTTSHFKNLPTILMSLVISLTTINTAAQDTLSIQIPAFKDNTLYEDSLGSLSNGKGFYFFARKTASNENNIRRGLIEFNIFEHIPTGSEVITSELVLHMSRTIAGSTEVNLHRVLSGWGESISDASGFEGSGGPAALEDATWLHSSYFSEFWSSPGGDYDSTSSATTFVSDTGSYSFGTTTKMSDEVQLWLDNPDSNFGWILIGNESQSITAKRFDTRENGIVGNRPVLIVGYVPPPCCMGIRGDVNNDGNDANILDLNFLVNRIFRFGPNPVCPVEADVNGDGNSGNILDLNFLVNRIFRFGSSPGAC